MKKQVARVLEGKEDFVKLENIYDALNVVTLGQKAAVRGILNRHCLEDTSLFERGENRIGYRLHAVTIEQVVTPLVETKAA